MRVSPISGDLLVKMALAAAAAALLWYALRRASSAVSDAAGAAADYVAALPGRAYDATAEFVRVEQEPFNSDLGDYSAYEGAPGSLFDWAEIKRILTL